MFKFTIVDYLRGLGEEGEEKRVTESK
jgi:hypothetical protein